jgi:hypothetical protein
MPLSPRPQGTRMSGDEGLKNRWAEMSTLYEAGAWDMNDADRAKVVKELSKPVKGTKTGEMGLVSPFMILRAAALGIKLQHVAGVTATLALSSPESYPRGTQDIMKGDRHTSCLMWIWIAYRLYWSSPGCAPGALLPSRRAGLPVPAVLYRLDAVGAGDGAGLPPARAPGAAVVRPLHRHLPLPELPPHLALARLCPLQVGVGGRALDHGSQKCRILTWLVRGSWQLQPHPLPLLLHAGGVEGAAAERRALHDDRPAARRAPRGQPPDRWVMSD